MTEPILHLFRLRVADSDSTTFEQIGQYNFNISQQEEAGTLAMYLTHHKEKPSDFYIFEVYQDKQAYEGHLASSQYQYFLEKGSPLIRERFVYPLSPIFLKENFSKKEWKGKDIFPKLAHIRVIPEKEETFKTIVLAEMKQALQKEKGVLAMYAMKDQTEPNSWFFYEIYQDEEAYQLHRTTEHFKHYLAETSDCLSEKLLFDLEHHFSISKGKLHYCTEK